MKIKTYVLTVSPTFPTYHKRKGEPTKFWEQITQGIKIHTIRANYPLWDKRIKEIQEGKAILSVRQWSGKPYNSKQEELFRFDKTSGIGIQMVEFGELGFWFRIDKYKIVDTYRSDLCRNDGLTFSDFQKWFDQPSKEPYAIIHFTHFRY